MDSRSGKNATDGGDFDVDFYVKHSEVAIPQIKSILKHKKMSEEQIESFIAKVVESRNRVRKYAFKFIEKVNKHYGMSDYATIITKAAKFSGKHKLSNAERDLIISLAIKGDTYNNFNPLTEIKYTEMAKFMGVENTGNEVLNLDSKDYAPLNEITKMFEFNKILHMDIKNQSILYTPFSLEALSGKYESSKHNLSTHVHPVVAALFLPKIEAIETRMLYCNIARLVLSKAIPYVDKHMGLFEEVLPGEMQAELELSSDIVKDPNSLAYFSDDTPIANIMKRFKIQIELWKNVLSLRQGKYYASGYEADGINGFLRALGQYDWAFFDSPDMYHIQDEGMVLRKLLAVFSLRPTFAQVTNIDPSIYLGNMVGNVNVSQQISQMSFFPIPIINVKLPMYAPGGVPSTGKLSLENSLNQSDVYIHNRTLAPKSRHILFSNKLVFFHINRKQQQLNVENITAQFRYTNLPLQSTTLVETKINDTAVAFKEALILNKKDRYVLRSVVAIRQYVTPSGTTVTSGSLTCLINYAGGAQKYLLYDPGSANIRGSAGKPIGPIVKLNPSGSQRTGFNELCQELGTIFIYSS